jgi:hypothetical protein
VSFFFFFLFLRGFHHHWVYFLHNKKKIPQNQRKEKCRELISTQGKKKPPNLQSVRLAQESENQICYKKWVKNQTFGNGLSRRIDVVSCGNAVRKEGRKEGRKEKNN